MAYAAYRESFGTNSLYSLPDARPLPQKLLVLDVTVPSRDAYQVRRVLAGYPEAGVVRCVPRPRDSLVRLEIRLPADRVADVMHLLMTSLPSGEMGSLNSWQHHLTTHGMTYGF